MTRFARERRVYFVEEPVFDSDVPRLEVIATKEDVTVVVAHLPAGSSQEAQNLLQRTLIDELLISQRIVDPILWLYTAMAFPIAGHIRASVCVYDCMDDLASFDGAPAGLGEYERALLRVADLVFTGGQSLYEAKKGLHPRVFAFPSSVDEAHFARAREANQTEPADLRALGRPRLGYVGVIDERIDRSLLERVSQANASWQVVLVGPVVKIDFAWLPQAPNLHYVGPRAYGDLPAYLAAWDVCLMPFALNQATHFISPTKTLEYLAAGKKVVSTAVPDVVRTYGAPGLVRIGAEAGFVQGIVDALAESADAANERQARADAFVASTSWDRTWAAMNELVLAVADERSRRPSLLSAS